MGHDYLISTPRAVRALIASAWLENGACDSRIGEIELAPHQLSAVRRIRAALDEFGGALLCDVVGSGKTYVALATAAGTGGPLVIAPATLRGMWRESGRKVGIELNVISAESLSRNKPVVHPGELIIIDEAHHFRNSATLRYRRLSELARGRKILLVTATPIHNSRRDLTTLCSLFLGHRADHLTEDELARLLIRREKEEVLSSSAIPETGRTIWIQIPDRPEIARAIVLLPPSVPMRDSGEAQALLAGGLARQWASSEEALRTALRRRLVRGSALEASLESGTYPSEQELRSWITGDDAVQLGFAGLLGPLMTSSCGDLLRCLRQHTAAINSLSRSLLSPCCLDEERAAALRQIRERHPSSLIVAFASYAATVKMLFARLAPDGGVAALTAGGGRVAGGVVSRREVLAQFGPGNSEARASEEITLLLTTDLLSEGVNLQRANVAVHLDLPWTPARLEQRVGRIARIGSRHQRVAVYGFAPPASAEEILRNKPLLARKWGIAATALGKIDPLGISGESQSQQRGLPGERLRRIFARWLDSNRAPSFSERPLVAAVRSSRQGFVALVTIAGSAHIVCTTDETIIEDLSRITDLCASAGDQSAPVSAGDVAGVFTVISEWLRAKTASRDAGLGSKGFLGTRRRLLDRISGIAANAPPHVRPLRASAIEAARFVAIRTQPAAVEREFDQLASSRAPISDDEWLSSVIALGGTMRPDDGLAEEKRIRAVLLLRPVAADAS